MSTDETDYTDEFVGGLELMWGEGFLSPGGAEEVALITRGLDLHDKEILDVGSGLGGPAICLASQYGAGHVTGIDIDPLNVERANNNAVKSGVTDKLLFNTVEAGGFPFADESFDIVFSKDSIIEAPNKEEILSESFRVLRPDGWLAIGDWFCGLAAFTPEMEEWLTQVGLTLEMTTIEDAVDQLQRIGFRDVQISDRNKWYQEYSKQEVERMSGEDRQKFDQLLGEDETAAWIKATSLKSKAVAQGQLRPGHLRARKP